MVSQTRMAIDRQASRPSYSAPIRTAEPIIGRAPQKTYIMVGDRAYDPCTTDIEALVRAQSKIEMAKRDPYGTIFALDRQTQGLEPIQRYNVFTFYAGLFQSFNQTAYANHCAQQAQQAFNLFHAITEDV